MPSEKNKIFF